MTSRIDSPGRAVLAATGLVGTVVFALIRSGSASPATAGDGDQTPNETCSWIQIGTLPGGRYFASGAIDPGNPGTGDETLYVYGGLDVNLDRVVRRDEILQFRIPDPLPSLAPSNLMQAVDVPGLPARLPYRWGHSGTFVHYPDGTRRILWIGGSGEMPIGPPTPTPTTTATRDPGPIVTPTPTAGFAGRSSIARQYQAWPDDRLEAEVGDGDALGEVIVFRLDNRTYEPITFPALKLLQQATVLWRDAADRQAMVIVGGREDDRPITRGQSAVLTLSLPVRGGDVVADHDNVPLAPRVFGHTLAFMPASREVLVYGGTRDGNDGSSDVVRLTFDQGPGVAPTAAAVQTGGIAPVRFFHAAAFDSAHQRMVVYGGIQEVVNESPNRNDTTFKLDFTRNPPTWIALRTGINAAGLYGATMVYDSDHQVPIVFGGRGKDDASNGIHYLKCEGDTVPTATPSTSPTAIATPTATGTDARVVATITATASPSQTPTRIRTVMPTATRTSSPTPIPHFVWLPLAGWGRDRDIAMRDTRCKSLEQELNNTSTQADGHAPLAEGMWTCGWLRQVSDTSDIFWLEVHEAMLLKVWLHDIPPASRYDVSLYGENRRLLEASDDPRFFVPGRPTPDPQRNSKDIGAAVRPGVRYYVWVEGVQGLNHILDPDHYLLRWTLHPVPLRADARWNLPESATRDNPAARLP